MTDQNGKNPHVSQAGEPEWHKFRIRDKRAGRQRARNKKYKNYLESEWGSEGVED